MESPTFRAWMTPREINALYMCKQDIRSNIEPVLVASTLHRYNRLAPSVYSSIMDMFRQGIDRGGINEYLISHIPSTINLEYFVRVLDECGYRNIATRLFLTYVTGGISYVYKSTSGQRPGVHKFFRNLKRMVHDAQFQNPRLALRQLANRFVDKMQNETNPVQRQVLADKCIAVIGAEIDAIAITFDKRLHVHDVFTQMKQLVSETSNTSITDVVYFGRLANANSIAGKFDNSEGMLTEARCRAYNTGPCLELVNMLYIEVYVKLWEFEKYPTEELRKQLMMWGRIGLESLENEDVDTRTLWRRMFILRMVFCLLGIGNRANIIENCPTDDDCLRQARELLGDIDRTWYGIETRRKMFYFVAKARLNELTNSVTACTGYIVVARNLAKEGHFEEIKFIEEYHERLIKRTENLGPRPTYQDQYKTRNFVLLRNETDDSTNGIEYSCILAATDREHTLVLLNVGTEIPICVEDRFKIYKETDSRKTVSVTNICPTSITKPLIYQPVAQDEKKQFVLLKSFEASADPRQNTADNSIEPSSIYESLSHDNTCLTRNFVLLYTSQDGSMLSLFNDNVTPSSQSANISSLHLISTEQQAELSSQLVLTDLYDQSRNFILINSNVREQGTHNMQILPSFKLCDPMPGILSPRPDSFDSSTGLTENATNNYCRTDIKGMFSQHNRLMTLKDESSQVEQIETTARDQQENMQTRESSYAGNSQQNIASLYSAQLNFDLRPPVAGQPRCIVQPSDNSGELESLEQRHLPTDLTDIHTLHGLTDREVAVSPDQRLNIDLNESHVDSTGSNGLESASNFDLIPASAYQGLPRYFMVQPHDTATVNPLLDDRSEPSGCSDTAIPQSSASSTMNKEYSDEDCSEYPGNPDVQPWSIQSDELFGE